MRKAVTVVSLAAVLVVGLASDAAAQSSSCPRAVIFTLPGTTWADVAEVRPPNLLEIARQGAIGSMSVRTNASRTTYASGFATIGAGARVDGGRSTGGVASGVGENSEAAGDETFTSPTVAGIDEMRMLLDAAGYSTVKPGALAEALGGLPVAAIGNSDTSLDSPAPEGYGRWALLAAMDTSGRVDLAATDSQLLDRADAPFGLRSDPRVLERAVDEVAEVPCAVAIVDPGDLTRADAWATRYARPDPAAHADALLAADRLLGHIDQQLTGSSLLMVVSPTSPGWDPDVHFGVAIAKGPGFPAGSLLESPATRRPGMVTLPDVAPTVLDWLGIERPSSMLGRPMFGRRVSTGDRIATAISLDEEAGFVDAMRTPVSTAFVIVQVVLFLLVLLLLRRRERRGGDPSSVFHNGLVIGALSVVAFPVATYLAGLFDQAALGPVGYLAIVLGLDAVLVTAAALSSRDSFDRLLVLASFTCGVLSIDLLTGANLQLNTVFSYSPLVAGRFAGLGNLAYSVLAAATILTGTLLVHRAGRVKAALTAVGGLFVAIVVIDGAPTFGSDVGGVIALVPGLAIGWMLLAGKRLRLRHVWIVGACLVAALALFLAWDLSQPEESRTHLARLFEDVRARGVTVFANAIERKIASNLRVFGSTIWTYLVPPALALIGWLVLRPGGAWRRVADAYPLLRAGLIAGLILAVLGFAVNDSGIVVPAMMLSFLVPLALLMHLSLHETARDL